MEKTVGTYPVVVLPEPVVYARHVAMPRLPDREHPRAPIKPRQPKRAGGPSRSLMVPLFLLLVYVLFFPGLTFLKVIALVVTGLVIMARSGDVRRFEDETRRWHEYESEQPRYESLKAQSDAQEARDKERLWGPAAVEAYRKGLTADALAAVPAPSPLPKALVPRSGAAEGRFYDHLRARFGGLVVRNATLFAEDAFYDRPTSGRYYVPDFVYYDAEKGVAIDIEIDEPYSLDTREPIHLVGSDDARDEFFSGNGWAVVRFAEAHVLRWPGPCCDLVNAVADAVALGVPEDPVAEIPTIPRWDFTEASRMAGVALRENELESAGLLSPETADQARRSSGGVYRSRVRWMYSVIRSKEERSKEEAKERTAAPPALGARGRGMNAMEVTRLRSVDGEPTVYLVDEHHGCGCGPCTDGNVAAAESLIAEGVVLAGVEGYEGGLLYDDYDDRYCTDRAPAECSDSTRIGEYPRFAEALSEAGCKVIGVDCRGFARRVASDVSGGRWDVNDVANHPFQRCRSKHFVRTLVEEATVRGLQGDLLLNCGSAHNDHIAESVSGPEDLPVGWPDWNYVRLRCLSFAECRELAAGPDK